MPFVEDGIFTGGQKNKRAVFIRCKNNRSEEQVGGGDHTGTVRWTFHYLALTHVIHKCYLNFEINLSVTMSVQLSLHRLSTSSS